MKIKVVMIILTVTGWITTTMITRRLRKNSRWSKEEVVTSLTGMFASPGSDHHNHEVLNMKTFAEFKKKSNSKSNNTSASIHGQDLSLRSFTNCFWSHFLRTVICSCRQQENMLILLPVAVSSSHLDKQSRKLQKTCSEYRPLKIRKKTYNIVL